MVFIQGHSSPGIYARAYLEGRLTEEQLRRFREEVGGGGLSSYPHPWLMPDFWQFPTVSMGLGPMMAIYQARFIRYLEHRGIVPASDRKVWAFLGDGEMDEPESLGAITMPVREKLDNLVFVINCNLQRLDGPVRGNGKIIQELEAAFLGAGWNVIKVVWGSRWDPLLQQRHQGPAAPADDGMRRRRVPELQGQGRRVHARAFLRQVSGTEGDGRQHVRRGHLAPQPRRPRSRARSSTPTRRPSTHKGQPTVILAKTVKGFGIGARAARRRTSRTSRRSSTTPRCANSATASTSRSRTRTSRASPYYRPAENSEEIKYLQERRKALGGYLPQRSDRAPPLKVPALEAFAPLLESSGEREISTTMAFVRLLGILLKDKEIGPHVVPIVPDEARTFGMEGMFRQIGIYSSMGQLYTPQDADQLLYYREDKKGQILEEGINEGGAMCSWIAAGTAYANHGINMVPFYIYYSMFGFQRVGDFAWAAGDMQARGFLLGGTAGRTTLAGEGLQHQDGHSQLVATTIPNCVAYDPAYAYELAVIVQDGLRRMYAERETVFYYITCMNENYAQPAMPQGAEPGILKGMYLLQARRQGQGAREPARLRHDPARSAHGRRRAREGVRRAGRRLQRDQLLRAAARGARRRALEPAASRTSRRACLTCGSCSASSKGPFVAATDYMRIVPDQIRQWVPGTLPRARHGRLRPQRLARRAARLLRGRSPLRRGGRAQGAGRRGQARPRDGAERHREVRDRSREAQSGDGLSAR